MNAEIIETPDMNNGYRWVVRVDGESNLTYLSGVGAPKSRKVGDRGTLTYRSSTSRGGYFWMDL